MKINILGAGTAGLVTALILKTKFPNYKINIIKSDDIGIVGVGEGSTEHWAEFMSYVGIKFEDLIKETGATLKSGIYYARGHFVFTDDQSKIISKYSDNVDTNIGFKVVEDVVTASDNSSLYDNQGAVPNVAAPGADRFRITLTIAEESDIDSDENFIHVATVKEGSIYSAVSINDAYNIPNDVVAKRIFENSGDYIVKPYTIDFSLDSQNTHLLLNVSAGTAVVDG